MRCEENIEGEGGKGEGGGSRLGRKRQGKGIGKRGKVGRI